MLSRQLPSISQSSCFSQLATLISTVREAERDRMDIEDWTPRMWFLSFVGWGITILTIRSFVCFWKNDYHLGVVLLVSGLGLSLIFFRNRKILLTILGLTFIGVNAGLDALFHPSATSVSLTIGSADRAFLYSALRAATLTEYSFQYCFTHSMQRESFPSPLVRLL